MEQLAKHKRAVVSLGIITLVVAGIIFTMRQLSKPVNAPAFTTIGNTKVPPVTTATSQPVTVSDAYAHFTYPSTMQPTAGTEAPTGEEVVVYAYTKTDTVPWHLTVTINRLHGADLTYDSAYLLRADRPAQYQKSTVTSGGNTFTIMTDTQSGAFSKVAFALHNNLSADISLTGDDTSGGTSLGQVFQQVLQSWQWQQ